MAQAIPALNAVRVNVRQSVFGGKTLTNKTPAVLMTAILSLIGVTNFAQAQVTMTGNGGCGNPSFPCLDFIAMPVGAGELPPERTLNFFGDGSVRTFAGSIFNNGGKVFFGSSAPGQQFYKHLNLNFRFGGGIDINALDSLNLRGAFLGPAYGVVYSGNVESFSVDLDAGDKISLPIGSFANDGKTTSLVPVYGILSIDPGNPGSPANALALAGSTVTVTGFFNSVSATPEPGAWALLGTSFIGGGLTFWRYRRKR